MKSIENYSRSLRPKSDICLLVMKVRRSTLYRHTYIPTCMEARPRESPVNKRLEGSGARNMRYPQLTMKPDNILWTAYPTAVSNRKYIVIKIRTYGVWIYGSMYLWYGKWNHTFNWWLHLPVATPFTIPLAIPLAIPRTIPFTITLTIPLIIPLHMPYICTYI